MSAAPYWGQLPGPKIIKHQRIPDDDGDTSLAASAGLRANRSSVQTARSDVPTETTFSPQDLESPTSPTFPSHGLAPRPPSFQRALADSGLSEAPVRSSRRSSSNPHHRSNYAGREPAYAQNSQPLPASFRLQQGRVASTSAVPAPKESGGADQLKAHKAAGTMDVDLGDSYPRFNNGSTHPYGATAAPGPSNPSRRASIGGAERRKNMTKEEKRARMEAAERRARERQARERYAKELYAMQPRQPAAEAVRALAGLSIDLSANPLVQRSASPPDAEPILQASSTQASEPDISQEDPVFRDQTVSYAPPPRPLPTEPRRPSPLIPDEPEEEEEEEEPQPTGFISTYTYDPEPVPEPVLPKRNLSFRERTAAQEDARFVTEQESRPPQEKAQEKPKRRFSLTRSGSNKLKKNPPDDPWYRLRMEAERKSLDGFDRQPPQQPPQPLPQQLPQHRAPAIASDPSRRYGAPPITQAREAPPAQGNRGAAMYAEDYDVQGIQRRATEPVQRRQSMSAADPYSAAASIAPVFQRDPPTRAPAQEPAMPRQSLAMEEGYTTEGSALPRDPQTMQPGDGLYSPPEWLDEWRKAPVGILSGHMLNLGDKSPPSSEKNKAWWEDGGRRRSGSFGSTPRKAEAYDGEYDDTNSTTRFKPPLYLECGPLLRYCGLRQDKVATKSSRGTTGERDRELWRGSIMIVTRDGSSSYEIAPILRLFVQDMELLPAAPHYVNGELSPEYVDPIAGHPKMGRRGETLFVRPVEHLEESRDLSQVEDDDGLFESTRSPGDVLPPDGSDDYHGSYSSRRKRIDIDGEKVQKYKDIRGFRLHAEHGVTFWRFNIEIELRDKQQRIAYRINRGPAMAFWVPAKGRSMNVMFHSCNGFSIDVNPDDVSGPDPMWRDVLNTHQTRPFHVMVGGGNQIYNDSIVDDCSLFMEWLDIKNPTQRRNAPFTPEMQDQLEDYYLDHYCQWFSSGLFGLANSQIPMVNICNDHDFYDSFGSYPYRDMKSPVMSGVGAVAFKYYMLFQHQSIMPETDKSEQSWVTGIEPGPFVNELSRSVYVSLGSRMALLAADTRTERTEQDIITDKTWEKIINRLYAEVRRGQVDHLLVVLPVPIAYPRLAWLEKALSSRAMDPIKSLGRRGLLGKALNDIDSGTQVIDDLSDHWTAKNHKAERKIVIEDLQDLAIDKSLRITILSGDVQLAAAGQLYSNPKMNLPKHKDPRYMPNIVSSGITDSPPTNLMADVINRRDKIHHLDKETDEAMIPLFETGVDGKPRNNKRLLPHRNWCSIRQWEPGSTPPPSPPESSHEDSATPPPPSRGGSLLRRLSFSGSRPRLDMSRESVRGPRPPIANTNPGGGLFRSLSRRNSTSDADRPGKLTRTLSWGRGDGDAVKRPGFLSGLMRRSSQSRPSIADSNGQWAPESDIEDYDSDQRLPGQPRPMGLRGGGVHDEYSDGDEANFTTRPPPRAQTFAGPEDPADEEFVPKPFHRTPTGLTTKQLRKAENFEVDLEGGLDVCFNVEVNCKDPTGITVPYRLLVPKLFYEYTPDDALPPDEQPTGLKRLLSLSKKKEVKEPEPEPPAPERESPPNHYPPSSLPPQFRVLPQPSTAQASHGRQGYP